MFEDIEICQMFRSILTWFFRVWIFSFGPNSPELLPCTPAKKSMVEFFNPKVRSFQWSFKYLRKAISSTTLSNVITALFSITICFAIDTIFSFFVFRSLNCLLMIRPQNDKNFLIAPFFKRVIEAFNLMKKPLHQIETWKSHSQGSYVLQNSGRKKEESRNLYIIAFIHSIEICRFSKEWTNY